MKPNFPYPHFVDHDKKAVYYVGPKNWMTALGAGIRVEKMWPGYRGHLCTQQYFDELLK